MFYSSHLLIVTTNTVAGMLILSNIGPLPLIGAFWYLMATLTRVYKAFHNKFTTKV